VQEELGTCTAGGCTLWLAPLIDHVLAVAQVQEELGAAQAAAEDDRAEGAAILEVCVCACVCAFMRVCECVHRVGVCVCERVWVN